MSSWGALRLSFGIIAACLGALLIALAVASTLSAAVIESTVGKSGVVTRPLGTLAAAQGDRAVVVDGVTARIVPSEVPEWADGLLALAGTDSRGVIEQIGDVALVAATPADEVAFLGVAPVDSINAYLDGTAYSVAVQPDIAGDGTWPTVSVPGDALPQPPESQALWSASASGTRPEVPGDELVGDSLVLMYADASPDPAAALRLEYRVAGADRALQATALSAALLSLGGLALVLLGGWAVVGRRRRA
jgi:hypothetical protein